MAEAASGPFANASSQGAFGESMPSTGAKLIRGNGWLLGWRTTELLKNHPLVQDLMPPCKCTSCPAQCWYRWQMASRFGDSSIRSAGPRREDARGERRCRDD
jgi:hypothetical protein